MAKRAGAQLSVVALVVSVVAWVAPSVGESAVKSSGSLCFEVSGSPGDAALVNLTPLLAQGDGNGQLVSSDVTSPPVASNVNFGPGTVDPNVAVAPIGADGQVCYMNSADARVDLVADHLGTFTALAFTAPTASGTPSRKVNTRTGLGGAIVGPSGRRCFTVAGSPGDAALVNLTPVGATGVGNGQLVSSDVTSPPVASNVNYRVGSIDPNVAIAPIGTDGNICFVNSANTSVHLVADHLGTIDDASYTSATASGAPLRRVDTRTGLGGAIVGPSGRRCFTVAGSPGDAALVNLTPVGATGIGNGQLVSSDVTSPPVASNVNYRVGSIDPNVAIAPIGTDGNVCFVNSANTSVHLVADHLGTIDEASYTSATASGAPSRKVDTRTQSNDCDGTFVVGRQRPAAGPNDRPYYLEDLSPSDTPYAPISLGSYSPRFEYWGLVVTGGCNAYYVDPFYRGSKLRRVSFDRGGFITSTDLPIFPIVTTLHIPRLIGIDRHDQFAWVWAEEGGLVGAPPTIWRIPLDEGVATRIAIADDCDGPTCAIAITRDESTVFWRSFSNDLTERGITQYDTATGQRRLLPTLGSCDDWCQLTPRLIVSADGTRLCSGSNEYIDLESGQLRPLKFGCHGFDQQGRIVTVYQRTSATVSIGVLDSDDDAEPTVLGTMPVPIYSWPILGSYSVG